VPAYSAQTLNDILYSQVATPRLYMILFGAFSAVAVALAALGVYGLFAYLVGRRTSEMAVRLAVGASRTEIVRMVTGEGLRLSLAGIGLGLLGTIALTRAMRSLLFEVNPTDPLTFGGIAILLLAVALAACYIPARRASKNESRGSAASRVKTHAGRAVSIVEIVDHRHFCCSPDNHSHNRSVRN
jgi:ABC-type antimicrobial peptide transport system permease subunit